MVRRLSGRQFCFENKLINDEPLNGLMSSFSFATEEGYCTIIIIFYFLVFCNFGMSWKSYGRARLTNEIEKPLSLFAML